MTFSMKVGEARVCRLERVTMKLGFWGLNGLCVGLRPNQRLRTATCCWEEKYFA